MKNFKECSLDVLIEGIYFIIQNVSLYSINTMKFFKNYSKKYSMKYVY